jgi:hypothetical protein
MTAASIGIGCGSLCGSSASAFLSSYILTEGRGVKAALRYALSFFLGKLLAVVLVCAAASRLGRVFIGADGSVGGFDLNTAVSWAILATAAYLIFRWFREGTGCDRCGGCEGRAPRWPGGGALPSLLVGFGYGVTPCAPLMLVAGYAATCRLPDAVALGAVFALASSLTPLLLVAALSGALSGRIERQLGGALRWLRLLLYLAFFGMALWQLV